MRVSMQSPGWLWKYMPVIVPCWPVPAIAWNVALAPPILTVANVVVPKEPPQVARIFEFAKRENVFTLPSNVGRPVLRAVPA